MHPERMTPERLAEIEKRCEAATGGPWHVAKGGLGNKEKLDTVYATGEDLNYVAACRDFACVHSPPRNSENAAFIAAARSDIPALLSHVRAVEASLNDSYKFAGHFYELFYKRYFEKHGKLPEIQSGLWDLLAFVDNELSTLRAENLRLSRALLNALDTCKGNNPEEKVNERVEEIARECANKLNVPFVDFRLKMLTLDEATSAAEKLVKEAISAAIEESRRGREIFRLSDAESRAPKMARPDAQLELSRISEENKGLQTDLENVKKVVCDFHGGLPEDDAAEGVNQIIKELSALREKVGKMEKALTHAQSDYRRRFASSLDQVTKLKTPYCDALTGEKKG